MKLEKKTVLTLGGVLFAAIFFAWVLNNWNVFLGRVGWVASLLFPLFLGFCVAFVLNVPMRFFERHWFPRSKHKLVQKTRRPLAILISLCFIISVLVLVCDLVLPELVNAFVLLIESMSVFFTQAQEWAAKNAASFPALKEQVEALQLNWANIGQTALTYITNGATDLLASATQFVVALTGGITNGIIGFIFGLYILLDKEKLKRQCARMCRAFLPAKWAENLFFVANLSKTTFSNFVSGQCVEACILGTLCWLGMQLLGFPYATMIGALVGVSALIPIVGAIVGTVVGAFMILMTGDVGQAIWFVVFLQVLQQIEGNLIYPRVVGSSVGLPSMWVLAAVTLGAGLWGIVGMLFAVPLASVVYALLRLAVAQRLGDAPCVPQPAEAPAPKTLPKATAALKAALEKYKKQ